MFCKFSDEEFVKLKDTLLIYEWSNDIFLTKLNVLRQDLKNFQSSNPIKYIKGRIKSPESIAKKLLKFNVDITTENAKKYIQDISGVRIICTFAKDISGLVEILKSIPDWKVIKEKDYINNPKPSGYRSYHLIIEIPLYFSGKTKNVLIEVQIRTAAMDFWASIEHQVRYKYNEHVPQHLCDELVICADKIAEIDERMLLIRELVSLINQDSA